jgi:DNA-binding GntR family transcriptional regulator
MEQDRTENIEMESSGKAEYIAEKLKEQILEGNLPEKTKLPSERILSQQYNVSRMTARRALQMLEGEGLVTRNPVHGTLVVSHRDRLHQYQGRENTAGFGFPIVEAEELRRFRSFAKEMEYVGHKPDIHWIEQPALIAASSEIAEQLQLPKDLLVFKRHRLQLADMLPYRIIESYYPADLFGELLTIDIGGKPLFDWLQERHGLVVARAREDLIARLATPDERHLLQISPNAPVVAFNRKVWTDTGRVVEWANIIAVAARYTFSYEYRIPERNHESRIES